MQLKRYLIPLIGLVSTAAFANKVNTPEIDKYLAAPAEKNFAERINDSFSWLENFYLSGKMGYYSLTIDDITGGTTVTPTGRTIVVVDNQDQTTTDIFWGISFGYAFESLQVPSRIEIEYFTFNNLIYNTALTVTSAPAAPSARTLRSSINPHVLMINFYYDADLGFPIVPYLGAGAGVSYIETDSRISSRAGARVTSSSESSLNFAWNLKAGIRYGLTESFILESGYQFTWMDEVEWPLRAGTTLTSDTITAHSLHFGITWQFD